MDLVAAIVALAIASRRFCAFCWLLESTNSGGGGGAGGCGGLSAAFATSSSFDSTLVANWCRGGGGGGGGGNGVLAAATALGRCTGNGCGTMLSAGARPVAAFACCHAGTGGRARH